MIRALGSMTATKKGCVGVRTLMLLTAIVAAGCAVPAHSPTHLSATPAPYVSPSGAAEPTTSVEAQRLAAAKNLNLKVIDKDGQQLFCRSNLVTGSHIQRDTRCYTAEQVDKTQEQTQRDLEQSYLRPNFSQTPGKGVLSQ
jgi:hypothetical protein